MLCRVIPSGLLLFLVEGFDITKTVHGKIAEFNLWNYSVSPRALDSVTCGAAGNIVSWHSLSEKGISYKYYNQSLENCGMLISTYTSLKNF